MLDGT